MPAPARLRTVSTGFLAVAARAEAGGVVAVEGAATLPGLPVRRLRLSADADRLFLFGPDMATLTRYVIDALRDDVRAELPRN
jgi:hypothetical protein